MGAWRWWTKRIRRLIQPDEFAGARSLASFPSQPAPQRPLIVHMLWIEGALTQLEALSCASFLRHGYDVQLWSYGPLGNVPPGVSLRNARAVLPEERLFRDSFGSHAAFADLFRYRVLCLHGGMWSDMDVICLTGSGVIAAHVPNGFLVTEQVRSWRQRQVNCNLIFAPSPRRGDLLDLAAAVTERYDFTHYSWGDCGPKLLTALAKLYPHLRPPLMEPAFANPISHALCPQGLIAPGGTLRSDASFLHCYNESWRRAGIDKTADWPGDSILGRLRLAYLPEFSCTGGS